MHTLVDICGCIATGKTTLASLLATHFGYTYLEERLQDNPYLEAFIENPRGWAVHNQLFFLSKLLSDEIVIRRTTGWIVRDYSIEDRYLYAYCFYMQGLISEQDYASYVSALDWLKKFVKQPDVVIFLDAPMSTLLQRLENRSWHHPVIISMLASLHDVFTKWAESQKSVPLVRIDASKTDFRDSEQLQNLNKELQFYSHSRP